MPTLKIQNIGKMTTPISTRTYEEALSFAKSKRTVIIGCCKNNIEYIQKVFENIKAIGDLFLQYHIVILENDSSDGTKEFLDSYEGSNLSVVHPPEVPDVDHSSDRLCYIRKVGVDFIRDNFSNYDFVLVMDMDKVCSEDVDTKGMITCFQYNSWAFMAPLMCTYYDLFALRADGLYKGNMFDLAGHLGIMESEILFKNHKKFLNDRWNNECPFEVHSAFCGMTIYPLDVYIKCIYKADNEHCGFEWKDCWYYTDCEHVAFNRDARSISGNPGYINPLWRPSYEEEPSLDLMLNIDKISAEICN